MCFVCQMGLLLFVVVCCLVVSSLLCMMFVTSGTVRENDQLLRQHVCANEPILRSCCRLCSLLEISPKCLAGFGWIWQGLVRSGAVKEQEGSGHLDVLDRAFCMRHTLKHSYRIPWRIFR